jgi:hypothetical protein
MMISGYVKGPSAMPRSGCRSPRACPGRRPVRLSARAQPEMRGTVAPHVTRITRRDIHHAPVGTFRPMAMSDAIRLS